MKLKILVFLLTILLSPMLRAAPGHAEMEWTETVTLVLVCDIYEMQADKAGRGGLAKVASVVASERVGGSRVIVAHAGDAISPSLMSGIDQGAHMIDLLNALEPDVFVPGNHEFDFGPEVFRKRMAEARFPVFAANLAGEDSKPIDGILASKLFAEDTKSLKIGVIGLTAEDSVHRSSPGALKFSSSLDAGRIEARKLREQGANLIVAVVHAPRKMDRTLLKDGFADIVLSGDDHDLVLDYDGNRVLAEAMQDGRYVVAIDVRARFNSTTQSEMSVSWHPGFRIIDTRDVEPDPAMSARVAAYQKLLDTEFDEVVATTSSALDSRNSAVRGGEAAIGNLFADAIRMQTGADVAILNGGGIRGNRVYPPGSEITRRDVLSELPFGNKTLVLEMTGEQLRQVVEQALAGAHKATSGGFPQVSGLSLKADTSRSAGNRIVALNVAGTGLDPSRVYRVATNDFLARGGNGYTAFKAAKRIVGATDGKLVANHVLAYLNDKAQVTPRIEGRVIIARK